MKLTQTILTKLTDYLIDVQIKANRSGKAQAAVTAPQGEAIRKFNPVPMAQAILLDSAIGTAVRVIGDAIAGLPVDVMRVDIEDGKRILTDDNDHEVNELLKRPNPNNNHDISTVWIHIVEALLSQGNAFYGLEMENSRTPNEMWPLPVDKVRIMVDRSSGLLRGYQFDNRMIRGRQFYESNEMLHVMLYNINDQWWGRSRTEPIERQVKSNASMMRENQAFFDGGARYDTQFNPEEAMNEQQIAQFRQARAMKKINEQEAHDMFVSPIPGKLEVLMASMKEMEFINGMKLNRENIYGMLGIPPVLAGILEGVNFATSKVQEASFWRHTMKPLLRIIETAFTRQIIWEHFDEDHVLKFDLSGVEALQSDQVEKANAQSILVKADLRTRDELRADDGLEPHEDGRGSEPLVSMPSFGAVPDAPDEPAKSIKSKKSPAELAWRRFDQKATKVESHFKQVVAKFFAGQLKRLLMALDENTRGLMTLLHIARMKQVDPEDVLGLLDLKEENALLLAVFGPLYESTVQRAGDAALTDFGISLSFNIEEPEVRAFIAQLQNNITTINKNSFKLVQQTIDKALEDGVGVAELTKRLRTKFTHLRTSQARTIARTESVKALNGSAIEAWKQSGVVTHYEWQPTLDSETRDAHIRTFGNGGYHGEKRRIGESFIGGGDALRFPGDGPAHQAINCRCTLLPIVNDDPTADLNGA